ncbi:hypothetical protein BH09VER1_BH09VER1_24580 [soil metagenome]
MASEILCEPEILRDYLVDLLQGKSDLAGAKILSRKVANLQSQIEEALAREGVLILVLIPSLKPKQFQAGRIYCDPASIVIRCTADGIKNKTGKSAFYYACRVAALLELHTPPFDFCGEISITDMRELNIISSKAEKEDDEDVAGWDVIAQTKLSIQPRSTTN